MKFLRGLVIGFIIGLGFEKLLSKIQQKWATKMDVELPVTRFEDLQPGQQGVSLEKEQEKTDNLRKIEGIGPKIEKVLYSSGLRTYKQLAGKTPEELRGILDAAGIGRITDPTTWAEQAKLAAEGYWEALDAFQATLRGGRKVA